MQPTLIDMGVRICVYAVLSVCLSGCLEQGRPVVSDQSARATPPQRSDAGISKPAVKRHAGSDRRRPGASPEPIPVLHRGPLPQTVTVSQGDTLYRIAWRYGLTFEQLAQFNNLTTPFTIFPGQQLRLKGAEKVAPEGQRAPQPSAQRKVVGNQALPAQTRSKGEWVWPLPAPPQHGFDAARKGLDFSVTSSARVRATQAGRVVYAGNGIGGYERLIIIKHQQSLLSAYSFNGAMRVKEQTEVKAGQIIADIRDTGHKTQTAHFELRRSGRPVDPADWLKPG